MATLEHYKSLPKKRMGAGALFRNAKGEILVLRTTYKEFCEIPGGVVEDGESPRECCEREIKEEIGLDRKMTKLLCMDYQHADDGKTESIMFIFDGGVLSDADIAAIKLDPKEISEIIFAPISEARNLLPLKTLGRRAEHALAAALKGSFIYLENREPIQ